MTAPRLVAFRNLESVCADCGAVVPDRDYFDPDNRDNWTGAPLCRCRPATPPSGGE